MNIKNNNILIKKTKSWQDLIITNNAVKQILFLQKENINILGIRINIKKSGCANFTYNLEKVIKIEDDDLLYEKHGAKIYVSTKIMSIIHGTKIDYIKDGLNFKFTFNNPNAINYCGCGSSFSI